MGDGGRGRETEGETEDLFADLSSISLVVLQSVFSWLYGLVIMIQPCVPFGLYNHHGFQLTMVGRQ